MKFYAVNKYRKDRKGVIVSKDIYATGKVNYDAQGYIVDDENNKIELNEAQAKALEGTNSFIIEPTENDAFIEAERIAKEKEEQERIEREIADADIKAQAEQIAKEQLELERMKLIEKLESMKLDELKKVCTLNNIEIPDGAKSKLNHIEVIMNFMDSNTGIKILLEE